ncbi:transcription factor BIM1 isoform X2 [Cornus florida]|uniref:transcription factor BIM1 isoform X2 n=1 Tax=Cornus florida TaxID=4283 RepID=UPI00289AD26C|nr:transcription factor BIM1 isoform X2 [Cornus florida]
MELPQPRPFGTEGRKPTHDFLSLYSPVQQDPRPSQGSYLKTHDFLQPLEQVGKHSAKEVISMERTTLEKPPPPAPPPSIEHLLPGGIGTYSISHVSYINQRVPKPEGAIFTVAQASSTDRNEENSNCSSYTGSGFTLWEESAVKRGKTGKENIGADRCVLREAGAKMGGQWMTSSERPSLSSSNNQRNNTTFSSRCSSQTTSGQKNQSFMNMIKSAKGANEEEEDDDDEEFLLKKEPTSDYKGNLTVKVDGKSTDQKANTPRSKHSATEQRRRSKINDRFQMLREIIPHSDQKRDKASFLLEVIEYIQFLQEKVHKYEGSYQEWDHYPAKLMPWRTSHRPAEGYVDQSQGMNSGSGPPLKFSEKFEESNTIVSPAIPRNAHNPVESNMSTATTFKAMDYNPGLTNKVVPIPVPLQPNIFTPGGSSGAIAPIAPRLASDAENTSSHPQSQLWQSRSCTNNSVVASDKLKEQELIIESGTISISSVYSQGLLNTLTEALQSSGVDLSQASISVQIDLGKQSNTRPTAPVSTVKDDDVRSDSQAMTRTRVAYRGENSDQALKRLKTGKS